MVIGSYLSSKKDPVKMVALGCSCSKVGRFRYPGLLFILVVGLLALAACGKPPMDRGKPASTPPEGTSPGAKPTPTWQLMPSPSYAMHVNVWLSPPTTERDMRLAKEAGFDWIKQRWEWRYLEPKKGQLDWARSDDIVRTANKLGLKIIARLDNQPEWATKEKIFPAPGPPDNLQDFADFVFAMVDRYKEGSSHGRIQAYEIWNEPNLAREWGNKRPDAKRYVEMLKLAYQAAKKADPKAIVISAGLSPTTASGDIATPDVEYLRQMYAAGAKDYFDMLGAHAAGFKAPPETSPEDTANNPQFNHGEGAAGRIYTFRHLEDLRRVMVENGDGEKQVAILEFGWTADDRPNSPYKWHSVTRQEQADYLVRAFRYARENWQPWVGLMTVIYIADPTMNPNDEKYHWAVTTPDGKPWPAYDALRKMVK